LLAKAAIFLLTSKVTSGITRRIGKWPIDGAGRYKKESEEGMLRGKT